MSQADGAFADRLVEQGIDVDLFPVRPLDDLDLRDLQHAIRKRGPIVLAAPRFWQEIFILVSSGRLADRESAMKILEVAVRGLRTPKGVDPETRKIAVTNLALGKRTKVGGSSSREALASNLGDYEHIWQLRAGGKKLRALLGMKASERRTTEATARRCFRTMTDYMRLLGQSQALSWAASELFPDAKTPEQVALQSICEARAWLRS